ncbi:MAG: hypothetical protein ACKVRP_04865 [Bacteroidota bacterium]
MNPIRLIHFAFGALVFFAAAGVAQKKNDKTPQITAADVVGTWWVKHDLGSMDGYQMESDGTLQLVNHYVWFGKTWELKKDTLTWVMYAEGHEPETARYIISEFSHSSFMLTPLSKNAGGEKLFVHQHTGRTEADSWTGRWTGNKGAFMDIIPQRDGFKIVIIREGGKKGDEYKGIVDGSRIIIKGMKNEEYITAGVDRDKRKTLKITSAGEFHRE